MFKLSKRIMLVILVAFITGALLLAGCTGGTTTTTKTTTTPSDSEAASVAISPTEAYNPIKTQHTLVAIVKDKNGDIMV